MVEKTMVSGVNTVLLAAADVGHGGNGGQSMITIPAGRHFYMTTVYGVAGVAGQIILFDSADGDEANAAARDAATKLRLYITNTGDGATGFCIGPFTSGVWVASDATVTTTDIADIVVAGYLE